MPWSAPQGQIMHKLGIIPGFVFANILYDTIFNRARGSGVEDRKQRMVAGMERYNSYGWGNMMTRYLFLNNVCLRLDLGQVGYERRQPVRKDVWTSSSRAVEIRALNSNHNLES